MLFQMYEHTSVAKHATLKFYQGNFFSLSLEDWQALENVSNYTRPPQKHNMTYDLWDLKGISVLVRAHIQGILNRNRKVVRRRYCSVKLAVLYRVIVVFFSSRIVRALYTQAPATCLNFLIYTNHHLLCVICLCFLCLHCFDECM